MSTLEDLRPKGNATVPGDAPIQPAQAFVDAMIAAASSVGSAELVVEDIPMTKFELHFIDGVGINAEYYAIVPNISFGGCALSASSINDILAEIVASPDFPPGTLYMAGGTNSAPTGQGLTDKATLIGLGWTVTTN